jgi:hypothetical protein
MIDWKFDISCQADIYLSCVDRICYGFYQNHRFYLLPDLPEKFRDRVVILPKTNFLTKCKLSATNKLAGNFSKEDKEDILKFSKDIYQKQKNKLKKLESDFSHTYHMVIPRFNKLFPASEKLGITISPSLLGSVGTYRFENNKVFIHPRFDRKIQNIYKLIVNALTHFMYFNKANLNTKPKLWTQKQKLTTKMFNKLNSGGILPQSNSMLDILKNNHSGNLAEQSAQYYKLLNYPLKSKIGSNSIYNLTKSELVVFNLLLERKNRVVSHEEIAIVLWKEKVEGKFSLYAISKTIERLRKKLENSGIENNLIHSQRGVGYLLYD